MAVPLLKTAQVKDSPLICIHGAWHGAWCWQHLTPYLEAAGVTVITPDLPGHSGDLSQMSLENYIQAIGKIICAQTTPVTLLGHSLAGLVITHLANLYPEKVKQLIYLAAFISKPDQCLMDCVQAHNMPRNLAIEMIDAGKVMRLRPEYAKDSFYRLCEPEDVQFALTSVCDQAIRTFTTPITYDLARLTSISKAYILCTEDAAISAEVQEAMAACVEAQVYPLMADHSPFFSRKADLAALIEKIMVSVQVV